MINKLRKLTKNNPIQLLIVGWVLLAAIAIVISMVFFKPRGPEVTINNLDDIVENIPDYEVNTILSLLADTLRINTDRQLSEITDIEIREGSYRQHYEDSLFQTEFIVDIESIRQSYRITNVYSHLGEEKTGLDYTTVVRCLSGEDVIFEDFICQDRITAESGLSRNDPIINLVPHQDHGLSITLGGEDEEGRVILDIHITIFAYELDNNSNPSPALERRKTGIREWLTSNGLDPDNYILNYNLNY